MIDGAKEWEKPTYQCILRNPINAKWIWRLSNIFGVLLLTTLEGEQQQQHKHTKWVAKCTSIHLHLGKKIGTEGWPLGHFPGTIRGVNHQQQGKKIGTEGWPLGHFPGTIRGVNNRV